jgi:hypothetical protein
MVHEPSVPTGFVANCIVRPGSGPQIHGQKVAASMRLRKYLAKYESTHTVGLQRSAKGSYELSSGTQTVY